jgi:hypothetical protein
MPFALNDTHIEGGTFSNVAGNMSQVLNLHVVHLKESAGGRLKDDPRDFCTFSRDFDPELNLKQQRAIQYGRGRRVLHRII